MNHIEPLTRPLRGKKRLLVQKKMFSSHPETYHRNVEIDESLMREHNNLQDIKSIPTFSKAKSEYRNKFNNNQDHILDIVMEMDKENKDNKYLQFVASRPFLVIAHSTEQLQPIKMQLVS